MNNSIFVVGRVGQNPTLKTFEDTGNKLAKFSVAVKDYSANTDEEKTMWIDVDAWNGLADRVLKTVTKGREIVLNGRLAMSSYSKESGGMALAIRKPVIKVTSFHLCGKRPTDQDEITSDQPLATSTRKKTSKAKA